ncbi:MAG: DsbA family protein [Saprospiraceae bacterium]|nr:DsbA family protein [Saprospiraceae bacterium]
MRKLLLFFCFLISLSSLQLPMSAQTPFYCDPTTGLCKIEPMEPSAPKIEIQEGIELIYVGDPMCSWCWGISPQLNQLKQKAEQAGIPYRLVLGGLRPGGGDPWNGQFKDFLRHHWKEVGELSGQPFGFSLFDQAYFNYDTEPACRAVVAARQLNPVVESRFFELAQHYFYVQNQDPKEACFYEPICLALGLDYEAFAVLFESQETKAATQAEFQLNRQWGVSGYPTILVRKEKQLYIIAQGYATFENMWERLEDIIE